MVASSSQERQNVTERGGHEPPAEEKPDTGAVSLWRGTDYGWWLFADTSAALAKSVVSFVIPVLVLAVSGSASLASSADALQIFILCALCFAGGVIQDRYDRKRLMLLSGTASMVLYALAAGLLIAADSLHNGALLWLIVPLLVLIAVRDGLLGNTSDAMLRGIVPDEALPHAMTVNSGRDAVVTMVGGPIGGALMAVGRAVPFLAGIVCALVSLVTTARITRYWRRGSANAAGTAGQAADHDDAQSPTAGEDTPPTWRDALGGLRWMLTDRFQRRFMIAAALVTGTSNSFLLITVLEVSQGGQRTLSAGFVDAAVACGMLVGAVVASRLVDRVPGGILVALTFVLLAVGFVGAALSPAPAAKAAFLVISVLVLPAGTAVIGGLNNVLVAKGKLGRVRAGSTVLQYGAYGLCAWLSGIGMEWLGYSVTCGILAAVLVAVAVYVLTEKALVTLPVPSQWKQHIDRYQLTRFE